MKEGDGIIFTCQVTDGPNEDHPLFILANKGEIGKIISKSHWHEREWYVQPKNHNPFYAMENEFEVIKKH